VTRSEAAAARRCANVAVADVFDRSDVEALAYRLYLSAQVLVTAISVLFVLWWGVTQVHDRQVAAADFACYDREAISFQARYTRANNTRGTERVGRD